MAPFLRHRGIAAPLPSPNVDTDVIIRIERTLDVDRADMGRWAFEAWRYLANGSANPGFVLNRPAYAGASVLLAGPNFGCGSSREMAVWALHGFGIRCILAPSFGDIFFENCFKNRLVPVVLLKEQLDAIMGSLDEAAAPERNLVTVDIESSCILDARGIATTFDIDPVRRRMLLDGVDELELLQRHVGKLQRFWTADGAARPWIYV